MKIKVFAWPKDRNRKENPYNYLLYSGMSNDIEVTEFNFRQFDIKGADILHVHWPDRLLDDKKKWRLKWRFSRFLKAIDKLHANGGKLVWTVHNLHSREIKYPALAQTYLLKFIEKVDGFIFLSNQGQILFEERYGSIKEKNTSIIPHMHYRSVYHGEKKEKARSLYAIPNSKLTLGFFGKIRANKGLENLAGLFNKMNAEKPHILVAGNPGKHLLSSDLKNLLEDDAAATGLLRYIEEEEVDTIFSACDAMIFPYEDILNSGSALLSLSLNRPIIAPNIGSFPDLKFLAGQDWVYLYEQPLSQSVLQKALAWLSHRKKHFIENETLDLSSIEPQLVSTSTESFYKKLAG